MKKNISVALLSAVFFFVPLAVSHAEDGGNQKLNEILQNQKLIMEALEQIKSELQIIKVRATR